MTTRVRVEACCPESIEVVVSVSNEPGVVLQNGESYEVYVYAERIVSVRERTRILEEE